MSRAPAGRPGAWTLLPTVAWVVGVVALSVWLIPQTPEGTWMRWAAWAAAPAATGIGVWLLRTPRSSRLRQR